LRTKSGGRGEPGERVLAEAGTTHPEWGRVTLARECSRMPQSLFEVGRMPALLAEGGAETTPYGGASWGLSEAGAGVVYAVKL